MGSRAKRKLKHKLNNKKYVSYSKYCRTYGAPEPAAGNISRKSNLYEALGNMERSSVEPRGSSCCSDKNLPFQKMFPISIISPHDFKTDPTRAIRTSRESGTRSDELETLLFQCKVDEFLESSKRIVKEPNIITTYFPTLMTEIERIGQDLLRQLAFINNHSRKLSETYERPDQPVQREELLNTESKCDISASSFVSLKDEQFKMEQIYGEILICYRPETNTTESSMEQYPAEDPDRNVTQYYHEKQETDNLLDPLIVPVFEGGSVEQITIEQETDEEIMNYCRSETNTTETNTTESSREQYQVESPDSIVTQCYHEKKETDNMLDPVIDLVTERKGSEDDKGAQATKSKKKKSKKKKKKKKKPKSEEDLSKDVVKIYGTKVAFDIAEEEKGIMEILNFYTEMSVEESDDFERYINFLEYHCYIIKLLIKEPDGLASLRSKFDQISSKILVHQIFTINHHFFQAVLYCIILARRASEKQKLKLQQYFSGFIEDNKHQKYNEAMLSESNDTIIDYFRIMAENGSMHPVEWYKSLKQVSLNIQKTRSFPGSRPAQDHWTDTILCCTSCDELMPMDPRVDSLIINYIEGSEDFKKGAWYHWLNTRRLPWINAISAFELNRLMEASPSP
ncbi:hypothetical protein OnM2_042059 [Erysiphe neolycopersici]|uniref:Uncharacterized protein n=1 Tax=Erysiphe neolycopersici TaxID=212602 RepID=A0A420HVG3_9PEZI|nr:hypothetical protein OnM2_042059 [Erysiphe neolycopersici]